MRGALRPAITVLLLVGVGLTVAGRRVASACPLGGCCAALDEADADGARADLGTPPVAIELPAPREGAPIELAAVAPATPARAPSVLAEAPKTSPPA